MNDQSVESGEQRLSQAHSKLVQATRINGREAREQPSSVFTNSQRAIEHGLKSVFILMGVQAPTDHEIPLDSNDASNLVNATLSELDQDYAEIAVRLLFINDLYASTYPVSEYGFELRRQTIVANQFMKDMEASQCYNHAVESVRLVRKIFDESRRRLGMVEKRRESHLEAAFDPE